MKVVLAGNYPDHTFEKLTKLLPSDKFELEEINTPEAYDAMTDAEIIILRIFKAPAAVLERNKNLEMVMRWGAGYDSVDVETANRLGILVTNTPGANANAVSELAVTLMLAVYRKLLCNTGCLRKGEWSKNTFLNESYSLFGKTVGIIGGGNIGRMVASKVQAFGAETIYYDPYRLKPEMEEQFKLAYHSLEDVIAKADILTLHVPLLDSTKHMIDKKAIKSMKKGAVIINTARGGLVDDHALYEAVCSGQLMGAGLDGVEDEPLPADHELYKNDNIIVTPHVGGGTADIGDIIIPMLVQDIKDYAETGSCAHVVNNPSK